MMRLRLIHLYLASSLVTFAIGLASVWFLTVSETEISPALPTDVPPKSSFDSGSGMGGTAACHGSNRTFDDGLSRDKSKDKTKSLRILSNPKAVYTDEARRNGVEGSVLVKVSLLASGKVGGISVVRGLSDGLNEKAIAAASQIKFEPKKVNGRSVSVVKTFEYAFHIY